MLEAQLKTAPKDATVQMEYRQEMAKIEGELRGTKAKLETEQGVFEDLSYLKSDHGGVIMSAPRRVDMHKFWDKSEAAPFCRIGDLNKMRVTVPVGPLEYREIRENLDRLRRNNPNEEPSLDASILVSNRSDHIYKGRVTTVPERHEDNIPIGLTSRGGGSVAVRPSENQSVNEPVAQTYLIQVEILDPDGTITPGSQAKVKIHLRWRSAAWWVAQKVASALDWGLW